MEQLHSEFRIVAFFKDDVFPSPTQYKRKIYKTIEDANANFPIALDFYHQKQYLKHLESVSIEERLVSDWRCINSVDEE